MTDPQDPSVITPTSSAMPSTSTTEYHDVYALRRASSTMTSAAVVWLSERIGRARRSLAPRTAPLRILSLGCGDGDIDVPLLRALAGQGPSQYLGVDANPYSLARFRARLDGTADDHAAGLGAGCTVTLRQGDLEDVTDSADIVILSHVLYYFADPAELIARLLRDVVRTDGLVLIVHSAREGVPAVMAEAGLDPFLAVEDVAARLAATGLPHTSERVLTELDATEVMAASIDGQRLLAFLAERDVATLTDAEADRLRSAIRARCDERDGRMMMPEVLGFLELRCDLATTSRHGSATRAASGTGDARIGGAIEGSIEGSDALLDYRLLAARFDWPGRLRTGTRGPDGRRAILDIGCGTGRWLQALEATWPELRDDRSDRVYSAVDPAAGAIEAAMQAALGCFGPGDAYRLPVEQLTERQAGRYDLIWAMHSLYAVDAEHLDTVTASLHARLRPDGVAIIALSDSRSFYLQAGESALGRRLFVSAEDVTASLTRSGIPHQVLRLDYEQCILASDDLALRRYLWDESIGNSYVPAGGASVDDGPPPQPDATWWQEYRHGDMFVFPQHVQVVTFRGRADPVSRASRGSQRRGRSSSQG